MELLYKCRRDYLALTVKYCPQSYVIAPFCDQRGALKLLITVEQQSRDWPNHHGLPVNYLNR